jgi:hypothetical protein
MDFASDFSPFIELIFIICSCLPNGPAFRGGGKNILFTASSEVKFDGEEKFDVIWVRKKIFFAQFSYQSKIMRKVS